MIVTGLTSCGVEAARTAGNTRNRAHAEPRNLGIFDRGEPWPSPSDAPGAWHETCFVQRRMIGHSTLPSALRDAMPGDVIANKYQLERCLGEGGQGCVWRAQNLVLELPVALKLVHPESIHGLVPERLFREARAAATLGHPSIVRVFDIGRTTEGLPYLVMELLRGESLASWVVRAGRLAPVQALRLLLPIADGLVAAHAEGIIHRDVKPDNIFVALHGDLIQPKLLDFGLARRNKSGDNLGRLTDAGAVLGTPAYLSPEQASGRGQLDARADVWSFCATLYECLTGLVPFQGTTWDELRRQILEDEPTTLHELGVDDADLWQLLRRGLAKSPPKRWPTMQALGRALACWLLERGVTSDVCGVSLEARWLRSEPLAVSLRAAHPVEAAEPMPAPPGTRLLEKSTSRRRPTKARRERQVATASPVAKSRRPTPPESSHVRRWLPGAAVALACIAVSLLMTTTQRGREGGRGIVASSRAATATAPALDRSERQAPARPEARVAPAPVTSAPLMASAPLMTSAPSVTLAPSPSAAMPPAVSDAPKPVARAPGFPSAVATPPAPRAAPPDPPAPATRPPALRGARAPVDALDLMEPY